MAWLCSGKSNVELIQNLARSGSILSTDRVIQAMKRVDRANYVRLKNDAYQDSPQSIGHGATISAPHMHAYACEHLLSCLQPGMKVLDVGSGSGYLCAVFHHLVSPTESSEKGKVVGIEHIPQLSDWSVENLKGDGLEDEMKEGRIEMVAGDGRHGYKAGGPYNAIHVGAAAPVLPEELVAQLASPGRIFIPVGEDEQHIYHIDKDENGNVTQTKVMAVRYVPLTDRKAQDF